MKKVDIFKDKFPKLDTEKFILREIKFNDYKEFYEIYSNDDAVRYQQMKPIMSLEEAKKAANFFKSAYKNKKIIRWGITNKGNDNIIGFITLHSFDKVNFKADIGYMLNKNYWDKKIMSEVGKVVIDYGFNEIGLHRIEANIHPNNIASINLSLKLGFRKEGVKKDSIYNMWTEKFEDREIYSIINETNH